MLRRLVMIIATCLPVAVWAQDDRLVRLAAPDALVETGLLSYILPRFSLKTQVRVELTDTGASADIAFGDTGRAVFQGAGQVWRMDVRNPGHAGTDKLVDWLLSETGRRTLTSFAPDGTALFALADDGPAEEVAVTITGDVKLGHRVARSKCIRCHAVDDETRGWGIGSTPSFGVLRTLSDWDVRFATFFVRKPHAAFTQIDGYTDPFPAHLPSPIVPIELTYDELQALQAYVAQIAPMDLGKPIEHY